MNLRYLLAVQSGLVSKLARSGVPVLTPPPVTTLWSKGKSSYQSCMMVVRQGTRTVGDLCTPTVTDPTTIINAPVVTQHKSYLWPSRLRLWKSGPVSKLVHSGVHVPPPSSPHVTTLCSKEKSSCQSCTMVV